jgi:histidyl-tRNA synthetase
MADVTLSIPKGTRDFTPGEIAKRNYILDLIRKIYKTYGFQQIETPSFENLTTLMGKYGEEGDRLIFKIVNSGDFLSEVDEKELSKDNSLKLGNKICSKALRYDLTVPFARYVVMHKNEITFPFKRFQIQPVWRADRPQKGRYREFVQCDADVIGSNSLLNEVELIQMIDEVFSQLGIDVVIKINNRKILSGIADYIGQADKIIDITVAIDKLEKIGLSKVKEELLEKGLSVESIEKLAPIFNLIGSNSKKFSELKKILVDSEIGIKGIEELTTIFSYLNYVKIKNTIEFDKTLARGLNYYTGAIIEVKAKNIQMGSICGGGRYDNLTGIFGMPHVSGVGISFGADRIYDVLSHFDTFPKQVESSTKVLLINFGKGEELHCLGIVKKLREAGISSELYPEQEKIKKQFSYANSRNIPFVVVVGETEIANNTIILKDMVSGEQQTLNSSELIGALL